MKIKILLLLTTILSIFSSCEVDDPIVFDSKGEKTKIQFGPIETRLYTASYYALDTAKSYTFVYEPASVTQDTVWFDIYTSGDVSAVDRHFKLEQIQVAGGKNAVAGRDYKAFDDASVNKHYVIKANQSHTLVPIVLLRSAALKQDELVLQVNVVANENFGEGEERCLWRKVYFADKLSRPPSWTDYNSTRYFGTYSVTKHAWMIEVTGAKWDEAFVSVLAYSQGDLYYYLGKVKQELADYNNSHPGNPMKDENGLLVAFP